MTHELMPWFWGGATIALYLLARRINRRFPSWWNSPLLLTCLGSFALALALGVDYSDYDRGTHWLTLFLGPATVAFAVPIYRQRAVIRRHWPILLIGVAAGIALALGSSWVMASLLGLSGDLRISLLPRSISTPFALLVTSDLGGIPGLTAACVVLTGLFGAAFGEVLLAWLPLRTSFAKGALFGMGAHACGVAKARELGDEEASIAGVVMMLAGLASVALAPLAAHWIA